MCNKLFFAVSVIFIITAVVGEDIQAKNPLADLGITYIFKESEITGKVLETVVEYALECELEVFTKDTLKFPLIEGTVSLTSYEITRGDRDDLLFIAEDKGISFISLSRGEFRIKIKYVTQVQEQDGFMSTEVPLIPSVKSTVHITIPGANLTVSSAKGVGLKTEQKGDSLSVSVFAPGKKAIPLSWWKEKKRIEKIEAMATCEELINAYIGRGGLQIISDLKFNIIQGEKDSLSIDIAKGLNLLDVKAKELSYWNLDQDEQGQTLEVIFSKPVSGPVTIQVISEAGIRALPADIAIPVIVPKDAMRTNGYLAVFLERGLKIDISESNDIRQIDVSTLPKEMKKDNYIPHLGFRFIQGTFDLTVNVSEITPRVFASVFTRAKIGIQNIKAKTIINFDIKNAGIFGFSIGLPQGLKLLDISGANINSWNVKSNVIQVDLRSRAIGRYSLELLTDYQIKDPSNIMFPAISIKNVENERGYIEVEPAAGMKIQVNELKGSTQIDRIEIPEEFLSLSSSQSNILFFRYIKHPFSLIASVEHIKPEITARVDTLIKIEERGIEILYEITYFIDKAGVYNLEMELDPSFMVIDVRGANIDLWKKTGSILRVVLQKKMKGHYSLFVSGEKSLKKLVPFVTIPPFKVLQVKKEKGVIGVLVNVPVKILEYPEGIKDCREIELKNVDKKLRAAGIVQAYRYFKQSWELTLKTEIIHPRITGTVFNFVSIGRAGGAAAVTFEYMIEDAETSEFLLTFPENAQDIAIKGPDAKPFEKMEGNQYKVSTHSGKIGLYSLFANFRIPLGEDASFAYSGVKIQNIENQNGFLVVSASNEMEIMPGTYSGLVPIDYSDVDSKFKVGITDPILMSFRYVDEEYALLLKTITHSPASVLVGVIETAKAYSTISPNGSMMTDVLFIVRNTSEQFLRLKLPAGSEILHLIVNNKETSPKGDEEETLVPISGTGGRAEKFRIHLRYKSNIEKLKYTGKLGISFPQSKMKILHLGWTLNFPDDFRVVPGKCENIQPVDYFVDILARASSQYKGAVISNDKNRTISRNVPATLQGEINRDAQYSSYLSTRESGSRKSIYTGEMPRSGYPYFFMSLFPMDKPVNIEVRYIKTSISNVSLILVSAAVFFIVLLFCKFLKIPDRFKAFSIFLLISVILVIMVGSETPNPYLKGIVLSTIAAGVLAGIARLFISFKKIRQERPNRIEVVESPDIEVVSDEPENKEEDKDKSAENKKQY